jgi:hypothetical protein
MGAKQRAVRSTQPFHLHLHSFHDIQRIRDRVSKHLDPDRIEIFRWYRG